MPGAFPIRASRWRARPAPPRCAASRKEEHLARRQARTTRLPWNLRDHALFIAYRAGRQAAICAVASSWSTARSRRIRMCRWRATFCCSRSSAIPRSMPTALSGQCRRRCAPTGDALMSSRPYAAARRTLSIGDKLLEINWGLGAAHHASSPASASRCCIRWRAGVSSPGPTPQMVRFVVGLVHPRRGRAGRYPRLDEPRLSGLWARASAARGGGSRRPCRAWRAALDRAGPAATAAFRTDEDLAGAGACALSARAQRGRRVQAAQAGDPAGDDRGARGARVDGAQSRHGHDPGGGWLLRCCSWRAFPGGGSCRR